MNNAGTGDNAPFLDLTLEQWRHTVSVDLEEAFVCLQRAARHMVGATAADSSRSRASTSISPGSVRRRTTLPSTVSAAS